jgi:hypothetical protein
MIVIEDAGTDALRINLTGDIERLHDGTPDEHLTPAEYWANIFAVACVQALETGGAFEAFKNMKVDTNVQ